MDVALFAMNATVLLCGPTRRHRAWGKHNIAEIFQAIVYSNSEAKATRYENPICLIDKHFVAYVAERWQS